MSRYGRLEERIAARRCIVLDGAIATELIDVVGERAVAEDRLWGLKEVLNAPESVAAVHGSYVDAGCDVISTNTWGLPSALRQGRVRGNDSFRPVHWMDVSRTAIELARGAAADRGRDDVAVAFSINGDVDTPDGPETIRLLTRAFEEQPPDLILLETLSLIRESTYATVEALMATGLPVWLSFRRCRHGLCGVYGEHWGGPEGDAFGRAARRFEQMGVGALLANCIPPDHVTGMVSWLRDFTDLPLGVYPNLGYLSSDGWRHAHDVDGDAYAAMALGWRDEGAQIIGGCCGVGPEHIAAASARLAGTSPGTKRPVHEHGGPDRATADEPEAWTDGQGRGVFPIPYPNLVVEPGVAPPTQISFMLWRHLWREGAGAHQRCLDAGCGTGLLTVQLARNGAAHVHAIDADQIAVENTLTNAFRAGIADRVTAQTVDLYPWVPNERYDVIVANLDQTPVDPFTEAMSHRPRDYWGRNLVDHLIQRLPTALAEDGVAYVVQLSIIGQRRTAEQLAELGMRCTVADFVLLPSNEVIGEEREQARRVEELSDAYQLMQGGEDVIVAYLLEITHAPARRAGAPTRLSNLRAGS